MFSYASSQSREILGINPDAIVRDARVLFERIPDEDAARLKAGVTHAFATAGQWHHELRLRFADTVRWFECRARVHRPGPDALCADGYVTDRWSGEIWNRRKNGELYIEWLALNAVRDPREVVTHYVAIFSDITARKAAEERLQYLAQYDALTDLPNRSLLLLRLEQLIELAERSGLRIAVLFVDLGHFKNVNDSLGHEAGDLLLQTVARRIRSTVRHSDTVARMGGDEFVILLSSLHRPEDAARVAEQLLASVCKPVTFEDHEIGVSASIGICVFPDEGMRAADLIRNADTAMYRAKSGGRNRYEFYARELPA